MPCARRTVTPSGVHAKIMRDNDCWNVGVMSCEFGESRRGWKTLTNVGPKLRRGSTEEHIKYQNLLGGSNNVNFGACGTSHVEPWLRKEAQHDEFRNETCFHGEHEGLPLMHSTWE